ncbi:MAG: MotA/TolQ/ExbB proton channel family protein [Deltaproteobacteria bacterium]|nr:MotA/TolQ/ExbB proton channel family protein [Deltaproteobacteria bacterium]
MPHSGGNNIVETFMESNLLQAEWVLWFLLVLFVACIIVMLVKFAWFGINKVRAGKLQARVGELLADGNVDTFRKDVEDLEGTEAWVLRHALRYTESGTDVVETQMDVAMVSRKARMERGIVFLGTVGANAPFVGLFGTVLGVIKAFRDMSLESEAGAAAVMAGISEALVATAVGLMVAIPAVVAYNYLSRQVKSVMSNSGSLNEQVLLRLRSPDAPSA